MSNDRRRTELLGALHKEIVSDSTSVIFCPNNRAHRIVWHGALFDSDLVPCAECGPDTFIRVKLTTEEHPEWKDS